MEREGEGEMGDVRAALHFAFRRRLAFQRALNFRRDRVVGN